jgi:hypothetical protein
MKSFYFCGLLAESPSTVSSFLRSLGSYSGPFQITPNGPLIQSSIAASSDPDDLVRESSTVEEFPRYYVVETPIQIFDRYEFSMVREASTVGWRNNGVPALN